MDWFNFVSEVGDSFLEAYVPIVEEKRTTYTEHGRKYVVVVL
jgi:coproporphyrinogen III oxidase